MLQLLIPLVSYLFLFINIRRSHAVYSPKVVFNALWMIFGIIIQFGAFGVWAPSEQALEIVLAGIIGFNLAFPSRRLNTLLEDTYNRKEPAKRRFINFNKNSANGLIYLYLALAFVLFAVLSIAATRELLITRDFSAARRVFNQQPYVTAFDKLVHYGRMFLLFPLTRVISITAIIDWLFGRKRIVLGLSAILLVVVDSLVTGGRYGLVVNIVVMFLMLLVALLSKVPQRSSVVFVVIAMVAFLVLAAKITVERPMTPVYENVGTQYSSTVIPQMDQSSQPVSEMIVKGPDVPVNEVTPTVEQPSSEMIVANPDAPDFDAVSTGEQTNISTPSTEFPQISSVDNEKSPSAFSYAVSIIEGKVSGAVFEIARTFSIYYTGSVTYMGELLRYFPEIRGRTLGLNMVRGIAYPFFAGLAFLKVTEFPAILSTQAILRNQTLMIGDYVRYNGLTTMFLPFYEDYGLLGVFFETFVFSLLCIYAYMGIRNRTSGFMLSIFALLMIQVTHSSTTFFFYDPAYILSFLYMIPLYIGRDSEQISSSLKKETESV